ncbi:MAG: two-component sensor histidine kinase [Legionellales bacterium]|nr:two-component sensor histidine kinase [Legionellales bacterium]
MLVSIRKFLLVNLLVSIIITTSITAIGNYILDRKDIEYHLDSLLSQYALALVALIGDKTDTSSIEAIQDELNKVPEVGQGYSKKLVNLFNYAYEDKFQFQVWDNHNHLLLRSANAPTLPLSVDHDGFSNELIDNQQWRVFTATNVNKALRLNIAERYDIRAELGHRMARDDFYIMLLVYPLLALNIWLIIGRGLGALKRVTNEVAHRAPNFLEPVNLKFVPVEVKPLVEELNRLFLRLRQAIDREKRFAADAAHELRTPLAALKTQAQLLTKISDPQRQQEIVEKIIQSVDRNTHLIQQLLTLSRIVPEETDKMQNFSTINLHKLTVEEISMLVPAALDKNVDFELDSPDENLTIEGNATAISIMLRNLIDNAIRYILPNGSVKVKLESASTEVILTIIDNGSGIPAEFRSRVFERFYRILGTKQQGSGLGLSIVEQIARLHHATVKLCVPDNGLGLQVTVTFPKKVEE